MASLPLDGQVYEGQACRGPRKAGLYRDPSLGYKNHIGIDRVHGLIRTWRGQLPNLIDKQNTASALDEASQRFRRAQLDGMANGGRYAYRSAKNDEHMIRNGSCSQIHGKSQRHEIQGSGLRRTGLR
jgi:hypothetical protein